MILLALTLAQAVPAASPVLSPIGRQALPASGCAAFLWQGGPVPQLVAMVQPDALRIGLEGKAVDLVRVAARGGSSLGLAASGDYAGAGFTATLDLTVMPDANLSDGARVPAATLTVARAGGDAAVVPLGGLVGCAKPR